MVHSQPHAADSADPPRQKSTLFCQDCGYESPVDGDWLVHTQGEHRLYMCPHCRQVLTARPRNNGSSTSPVAQFTGTLVSFWLTPTSCCRARDDSCSINSDTGSECCA
jgi:hypothetical protein